MPYVFRTRDSWSETNLTKTGPTSQTCPVGTTQGQTIPAAARVAYCSQRPAAAAAACPTMRPSAQLAAASYAANCTANCTTSCQLPAASARLPISGGHGRGPNSQSPCSASARPPGAPGCSPRAIFLSPRLVPSPTTHTGPSLWPYDRTSQKAPANL